MVPVLVCAGPFRPAHAQGFHGLPYPPYSGYDIKGSGGEAHEMWLMSQIIGNYGRGLVTNAHWPSIQPSLRPVNPWPDPTPCDANQSAYDGYCFTNIDSLDWLVKAFSDTGARVTLNLVGVPDFASIGCPPPEAAANVGDVAERRRALCTVRWLYRQPVQRADARAGTRGPLVIHNEVNSPAVYVQ